MRNFQISFYKKLLSSDGHEFECLQLKIDVAADTPDQAIARAKDGIKAGKRGSYWIDHADTFEVEECCQPS
jgi:hypothetical protein